MIKQDVATIVRSLYNNFNNHTTDGEWLDRMLSVIADECEIVDIPRGATLRGKDGAREYLMNWHTALPDSKVEITNMFCTQDQAAVEFIGRGTHTGPLSSPQGEIAPTGRKVELRLCDVLRITNGKIVHQDSYYNVMTLMEQLGLVPKLP